VAILSGTRSIARWSCARERADIDCRFTVHAQAFDPWDVRPRLGFFLYWQRWHQFPESFSAAWLC
jgi:hypothetical protein